MLHRQAKSGTHPHPPPPRYSRLEDYFKFKKASTLIIGPVQNTYPHCRSKSILKAGSVWAPPAVFQGVKTFEAANLPTWKQKKMSGSKAVRTKRVAGHMTRGNICFFLTAFCLMTLWPLIFRSFLKNGWEKSDICIHRYSERVKTHNISCFNHPHDPLDYPIWSCPPRPSVLCGFFWERWDEIK